MLKQYLFMVFCLHYLAKVKSMEQEENTDRLEGAINADGVNATQNNTGLENKFKTNRVPPRVMLPVKKFKNKYMDLYKLFIQEFNKKYNDAEFIEHFLIFRTNIRRKQQSSSVQITFDNDDDLKVKDWGGGQPVPLDNGKEEILIKEKDKASYFLYKPSNVYILEIVQSRTENPDQRLEPFKDDKEVLRKMKVNKKDELTTRFNVTTITSPTISSLAPRPTHWPSTIIPTIFTSPTTSTNRPPPWAVTSPTTSTNGPPSGMFTSPTTSTNSPPPWAVTSQTTNTNK